VASGELRAAIEQTYAALAAVPRPRELHASPLRDAEAILRALTSTPLPTLPIVAIGPYSRYAITTVGTEQDFRHFLPRILELAATDPHWTGAEPPVTADRIVRAGWRDWGAAERGPVAGLYEAAFAEALARGLRGATIADEWLCGMALLGLELAGPLARWRADPSDEAALALALFVTVQAGSLRAGRGASEGFWEIVPPDAQDRVGLWLSDPQAVAQLEAAHTLPRGEQWEVEHALSILAGLRA
jgi:hypothetical protein